MWLGNRSWSQGVMGAAVGLVFEPFSNSRHQDSASHQPLPGGRARGYGVRTNPSILSIAAASSRTRMN